MLSLPSAPIMYWARTVLAWPLARATVVEPGYYAFFVFDPDGIRVEAFCWARDETVV
jgi:hypothetical protein